LWVNPVTNFVLTPPKSGHFLARKVSHDNMGLVLAWFHLHWRSHSRIAVPIAVHILRKLPPSTIPVLSYIHIVLHQVSFQQCNHQAVYGVRQGGETPPQNTKQLRFNAKPYQ